MDTVEKLKEECETLRMQLAACGTIALCNTQGSFAMQRISRESPYWSPSYENVERCVLREIGFREELERRTCTSIFKAVMED